MTRCPALLAALLVAARGFQAPRNARPRAAPRAALADLALLIAEGTMGSSEPVGPEVYGPIFMGGVGLFGAGVVGAAVTALIIDKTDAYEALADDFMAAGTKGLEEEFGAEATRSVIEDVKSGRGSADRTYFEKAPAPEPSAASASADGDGYDD
mmetsp:Transcript_12902/g.38416  ORF Transcript_12902/g.38416 Transcript_12902/m.38416 type:complete len:154 (-) Transcript_12902:88-549(-)|eukprot:CAMPEP_0119267926 /NCGR_PEP_ID=MMETSP1329-20130426/5882_1 /TAXON_ID=114041 /ORGANISM="Genus nov. species nov., Strain RCC1024" /LENGTH=153 /DNA_ID=CAMNT_0007267869 /DNA_START=167 /DNA_END=628 /DNA_ORIENTATION=-